MKTMAHITLAGLITGMILFVASCSSTVDKKAELQKLKKQHDQLAEQISKLESELKMNDTTTVKMPDVAVSPVTITAFNHYIEVQGKVDGEENTSVFPANQATVTAVFVKEGDAVKKGQILAQLDNSILLKSIETARVNADLSNTIYEKYRALWDKKIGSEVQFLQAKATKEAAEKNLVTLSEQLELYKVKSPINGTIEEVNMKVGQFASPASPLPSFRVVNFSHVKVMADIAEVYAPKVKPGNAVKIFFPDFNTEYDARLNFSSRYINPSNRSFQVETRLAANGKVDFRANMLAVVKINDYSSPKAIAIPMNLVKETLKNKYVWVSETEAGRKVARKRAVTLGQNYNGVTEVLSGLKEGDLLITSGYNSLIEGQAINVK